MIRSQWQSVANTGNNTSNFRTRMNYCDHCHATGEELATKEELKERLLELQGCSIKTLLKVYRYWKKTGMISCSECDGEGSFEEWK